MYGLTTQDILQAAKALVPILSAADTAIKNNALEAMAVALERNVQKILSANAVDMDKAKDRISNVMLDRLSLSLDRIFAMAEGIRQVVKLPDPVGRTISESKHSKGMLIQKVSVPMGVVAIIYESRPNVTSDAAALAIKSGNVCVLRGGKEAFESANAIVKAMQEGLESVGLPEKLVQLIQDTSRESATELMHAVGYVDLLIPRGGAGLIKACLENAKVPCIQTGTGICHIYVDKDADQQMALKVIENAKISRPSVCNAAEVCLVHRDIASSFLPLLYKRLVERIDGKSVELRLDRESAAIIPGSEATPTDFDTEFLDYKMAIGIVPDVRAAVEHITAHSTGHSESIITKNQEAAAYFARCIDSAAVYVNCSTRFTDGGEFGLGCEMGISTQKLHARGPMGLEELCSYKYVIYGSGDIR